MMLKPTHPSTLNAPHHPNLHLQTFTDLDENPLDDVSWSSSLAWSSGWCVRWFYLVFNHHFGMNCEKKTCVLFQLSEEGFCSHWKTPWVCQLFQVFQVGFSSTWRGRGRLMDGSCVELRWGLPEAARRAKIPAIKQKILERLKVGGPKRSCRSPENIRVWWLLAMEHFTMVDMVLLIVFPWRIRKIWNCHDLLDDSYWNVSIKSGEHLWLTANKTGKLSPSFRLWLIISRTKMVRACRICR